MRRRLPTASVPRQPDRRRDVDRRRRAPAGRGGTDPFSQAGLPDKSAEVYAWLHSTRGIPLVDGTPVGIGLEVAQEAVTCIDGETQVRSRGRPRSKASIRNAKLRAFVRTLRAFGRSWPTTASLRALADFYEKAESPRLPREEDRIRWCALLKARRQRQLSRSS